MNTKQVQNSTPTNISRHRTELCRPDGLVTGFVYGWFHSQAFRQIPYTQLLLDYENRRVSTRTEARPCYCRLQKLRLGTVTQEIKTHHQVTPST
jgi:hypothetical protein